MISIEETNWVRQALMKMGLLEFFNQGDMESFMKGLTRKTFHAGTKIIVEGDSSDFVYLIRKGEVNVLVERKGIGIPIRSLGEGEFFGEIAVLTHYPRNATVVSKSALEAYMIYREDFRKVLNKNPALLARFQKSMLVRSRETKQFVALASFIGVLKKIFLKRIRVRFRKGTVKGFSMLVQGSARILVFTGAGLSTASGFSEIHGKGGIWDRFLPVSFDEFLNDREKQKEYWRRKKEFMTILSGAKPNIGHSALSHLEKKGKLVGIITQNIDGLHQVAGNSNEKIIELNGTNRDIICLNCHRIESWQTVYSQLAGGTDVPFCKECGGLMKPNTISIGQSSSDELLFKALSWAKNCDLLVALGSSLTSEYAGRIIDAAKQNDAKFVIINLTETAHDSEADMLLRMRIEDVLPSAIVA